MPQNQVPFEQQGQENSIQHFFSLLKRRSVFIAATIIGLLLLCLIYCVLAARQYDATAKVAMRVQSGSSLSLENTEALAQASVLSAPLQQETLADVFRSDRLAWRVITELRLDQQPAFAGNFAQQFPNFKIESPGAEARQSLVDRFEKKLKVQTIPRTLLLSVRFRSKDPALAARIANKLVEDFTLEESESRIQATTAASSWLVDQLKTLKARVENDQKKLADYQRDHQLLGQNTIGSNGASSVIVRDPALIEIEDLGHQLTAATSDRIAAEANYRAAQQGNPELVLAGNPQIQIASGLSTEMFVQLHNHKSDLEQERAKLSAEYGPTYPRVVEIEHQLADVDSQLKSEDTKLLDRFKSGLQTAQARESLLRAQLDERTQAGLKQNQAAIQYTLLQMQAQASNELLAHVNSRLAEGGLAAGIHPSSIMVVDPAVEPFKPATPNLPLYLAITLFVALWIAIGGALLLDALSLKNLPSQKAALLLLAAIALTTIAHAQAPTPSTSGLPSGVSKPVLPNQNPHTLPNPKEAPAVWNQPVSNVIQNGNSDPNRLVSNTVPAPISPGDLLDISEFHTPEFHTSARVAPDGSVSLPLLRDVKIIGLTEQEAAHTIEKLLLDHGVLLHPQVSVVVTVYAGQDVSVLGEVTRPGVYAFTVHHRLLDLISAASGLSPSAGRLVNVFHRVDPKTPHPVVLDPSGIDTKQDHNPELEPGDTVQVSRAGLVYVIGDVVRPGGFPVDPVQGLTVVQAISLAWGATPNAADSKAILIREQKGGRTLTTLNLKKMLRGQEPDLPIHDRDILFVPDSVAKGMLNRTIEAAIQSAVGVSIYAGLVYSQRF